MPPLFKKKKNVFRLEDDGFNFGESFHPYSDIKHIFFIRILEKQSINFLPVGQAESAYLIVTLSNGEKIGDAITEAGFMLGFNRDRQPEIQSISDVYLFLSRRTFNQRAAFYTSQVESRGYFEYDGCRFYPHEKRITYKTKSFPVSETKFSRHASSIEMARKGSGLLGKVKREFGFAKPPQFVTAVDRDVIFSLLNHYFGLKWSN